MIANATLGQNPVEVCPTEAREALDAAIRRWGATSVSPFNRGADRELIGQSGLYATGYLRRGRWAVMATDPATDPGRFEEGLAATLDRVDALGLRPAFAAVVDPRAYRQQGLWTAAVADDPLVDLVGFDLSGKRRANVRHSVAAARRCGLRVVPWSEAHRSGAAEVSAAWLATKRGGELGFTLGRFEPGRLGAPDCRVALDGEGRVIGFVTWHRFDRGRGRVLDLMRRRPGAPNPTMDLLIAESLGEFAAAGVATASLGCVPLGHGRLTERLYPTVSLRRYKAKFDPTWEPRHLVAPSRGEIPGAVRALARSYVSGGLLTGWRRNG